jgi:hypothetical protein
LEKIHKKNTDIFCKSSFLAWGYDYVMNRLGNEVERGVTEMKGGGINTFRKNVIQDVRVTLFTCESILDRNLHPPPLPLG